MRTTLVVLFALAAALFVAYVFDGWRGLASGMMGLGFGLILILLLVWAQIGDDRAHA